MKFSLFFQKKLEANVNICEILDKSFEFKNEHRKVKENEYDSHFKDYREKNEDEDERTKYVNDKLSKLPIHEKFTKYEPG